MKTALVTGASNGIGLELARVFAREGWDLVLTARSAQKLDELALSLESEFRIRAHVFPADLSAPGASEDLFKRVSAKGIAVDALVNNAGIGSYGFFAKTDAKADEEMMALNIVALTELTKLFLTPMLERKSGNVLNVASTAGFQPGPLMAVYYASKAYVISFSQALANETKGKGVSVTVLCPGATKTGFQERARMMGSKLFKHHAMDAKKVAELGYAGMLAKKKMVIPGFKNKALIFGNRFVPMSLAARVARKVQEIDKSALMLVLLSLVLAAPAQAAQTYTNGEFLYAVDYPDTWHVKEMGKAVMISAPRENKDDKFSENVQVVAEDLSEVPGGVTLIDYHKVGLKSAQKFLRSTDPVDGQGRHRDDLFGRRERRKVPLQGLQVHIGRHGLRADLHGPDG
jgi:uncharacterized protein